MAVDQLYLSQDEGHFVVEVVPRTREVGQSWVTSAFTTLRALISSLLVLCRHQPTLILSNGPGTCVPLCVGAVMLRVLGVCPSRVVFVESLCRVHSLSLSGHLLYPLSDHFLVQWPQLTKSHPRACYMGRLVWLLHISPICTSTQSSHLLLTAFATHYCCILIHLLYKPFTHQKNIYFRGTLLWSIEYNHITYICCYNPLLHHDVSLTRKLSS